MVFYKRKLWPPITVNSLFSFLHTYLFLDGVRFTDSAFLVLSNRACALCLGLLCLFYRQITSTESESDGAGGWDAMKPVAPLHSYGLVSLSNLISTLCQYESLKFVTFAAQTIAKSTKMIPTLLMGCLVFRKSVSSSDLSIACIISLGVAVFMLGGVIRFLYC